MHGSPAELWTRLRSVAPCVLHKSDSPAGPGDLMLSLLQCNAWLDSGLHAYVRGCTGVVRLHAGSEALAVINLHPCKPRTLCSSRPTRVWWAVGLPICPTQLCHAAMRTE